MIIFRFCIYISLHWSCKRTGLTLEMADWTKCSVLMRLRYNRLGFLIHLNLSCVQVPTPHSISSLRVTPVLLVSILCPPISPLHPHLLHLIVFWRKQRGKIWNWSCFYLYGHWSTLLLCCNTDLKPQASQHNQSTSRRNVPRQKKKKRWTKQTEMGSQER